MIGAGLRGLFMGPTGPILFTRIYVSLIFLATGLGSMVLLGGEDRFAGPAFGGPRGLVSPLPVFDPYVYWGAFFLVYGLLLIGTLGNAAGAARVLRAGMVLYVFFAMSMIGSMTESPYAAGTGVVAYAVFFVIHLCLSDHLSYYGWE